MHSEDSVISFITGVGIIGYSYTKNEIGPLSNFEPHRKCFCDCTQHDFGLYTEINSKWIKNFNIRLETVKPEEENIGEKLFDSGLGNDFFNHKKSQQKEKWTSGIKLKPFCTTKETVNTTKRQPMEWEKIFANHISHKG